MISKLHRFHGHNSLNFVYRQGQTVHDPRISLKTIVNKRQTHYRAAVVVSKKVNKSAVVRNQIRRKLYEAIRQNQDRLSQPHDIVLTVFDAEIAKLPQAEVETLVIKLFDQAKLH